MRIRERLLPLIAVVVVVAVGVGLYRVATGTPAPQRHVSALEEIRAMLRDRAARLTAGDVDGYLAAVSPAARPFEENLARSSRSVPIAEIRITAVPLRQQDVESDTFTDLPVTFLYRYRDVPGDNHFQYSYLATFQRLGGAWRLTRDRPAPPEYHDDPGVVAPVWASGPVQFLRSGHFLAIYRPGLTHVTDAIALCERARSQLAPKVLIDFDDVHVVQLAADDVQYAQMLADPASDGSLGVAIFRFSSDPLSVGRDTVLKLPTDRHMIVNTRGLFAGAATAKLHGSDSTPVQVMQHELGHLALFRYDTPSTPPWLAEGGAMYLAGQQLRTDWVKEVADGSLAGFTIKESEQLWEVDRSKPLPGSYYPYANAAVLALIGKAGPQQWFDFYKGYKFVDEFANGIAQSKDKPTEILLQRFYQFDRGELDNLTRAYIHGAVGR